MSKKVKIIVISSVIATALIIALVLSLCLTLIAPKGKANHEYWSSAQALSDDYAVEIKKEVGKDFKVLQVTDIQIADVIEGKEANHALETLRAVIEKANPDLIVSTGDQVWIGGRYSLKRIIKVMDSFEIPWAPVMGNHDGEGNASFNWVADQFEQSKYCVFKKGPNNIGGVGNYIINVTEENKIVQTLYMLDSGARRYYPELDEKAYEFIQPGQIAWYEWAVNAISAKAGKVVPSMMFMHIPVIEYKTSFDEWKDANFDPNFNKGTNDHEVEGIPSFGAQHEGVASAPINSGLFAKIKELGSTKHLFAGHDHVNNSSVLYQGIRLSYGLKTGDTCYKRPDQEMNGGTLIEFNGGGIISKIEHLYIKL